MKRIEHNIVENGINRLNFPPLFTWILSIKHCMVLLKGYHYKMGSWNWEKKVNCMSD